MNHPVKIIPLLIIVAILSFSVRLASVIYDVSALSGSAFAEENTEEQSEEHGAESDQQHVENTSHTGTDADAETPPAIPDGGPDQDKWRDPGDEVPGYENVKEEVTADLIARSAALDTKEKNLNTREALLKAAEKELEQKYKELSQLRGEIEELLGKQSEEEEARIKSLVKVYEGMKPKDAARIFDTLDLDILMAVMGQMSERKMSPILAAMDPERARTITIMLAEQKQLPSLP